MANKDEPAYCDDCQKEKGADPETFAVYMFYDAKDWFDHFYCEVHANKRFGNIQRAFLEEQKILIKL